MRNDLTAIERALKRPDDVSLVEQLTSDEFRFASRLADPEVKARLRASRRAVIHRRWRESHREDERDRAKRYYARRRASLSPDELAEIRERDRVRKAESRRSSA